MLYIVQHFVYCSRTKNSRITKSIKWEYQKAIFTNGRNQGITGTRKMNQKYFIAVMILGQHCHQGIVLVRLLPNHKEEIHFGIGGYGI